MAKRTDKYKDLNDAYKRLAPELAMYARRHLISQDEAVDAVHEAFEKAAIWQKRNKKGHISYLILYRLTLRACRKLNRQAPMVSLDDPSMAYYFRT